MERMNEPSMALLTLPSRVLRSQVHGPWFEADSIVARAQNHGKTTFNLQRKHWARTNSPKSLMC